MRDTEIFSVGAGRNLPQRVFASQKEPPHPACAAAFQTMKTKNPYMALPFLIFKRMRSLIMAMNSELVGLPLALLTV